MTGGERTYLLGRRRGLRRRQAVPAGHPGLRPAASLASVRRLAGSSSTRCCRATARSRSTTAARTSAPRWPRSTGSACQPTSSEHGPRARRQGRARHRRDARHRAAPSRSGWPPRAPTSGICARDAGWRAAGRRRGCAPAAGGRTASRSTSPTPARPSARRGAAVRRFGRARRRGRQRGRRGRPRRPSTRPRRRLGGDATAGTSSHAVDAGARRAARAGGVRRAARGAGRLDLGRPPEPVAAVRRRQGRAGVGDALAGRRAGLRPHPRQLRAARLDPVPGRRLGALRRGGARGATRRSSTATCRGAGWAGRSRSPTSWRSCSRRAPAGSTARWSRSTAPSSARPRTPRRPSDTPPQERLTVLKVIGTAYRRARRLAGRVHRVLADVHAPISARTPGLRGYVVSEVVAPLARRRWRPTPSSSSGGTTRRRSRPRARRPRWPRRGPTSRASPRSTAPSG